MFELHEKLKESLIPIKVLVLSRAFLFPDSDNPWVVLVPQINGVKEWHHLKMEDQIMLLKEINLVSNVLEAEFKPDKINLGALGNMVPQFHVHIFCRYKHDKSWPGAIWGRESNRDQSLLKSWTDLLNKKLIFCE